MQAVAAFCIRTPGLVAVLIATGLFASANAIVRTHPTCRQVAKADRTSPPVTFPVDEIVTRGMVEKNSCSQVNVAPTPGELTLFVRPLHLWEHLSD